MKFVPRGLAKRAKLASKSSSGPADQPVSPKCESNSALENFFSELGEKGNGDSAISSTSSIQSSGSSPETVQGITVAHGTSGSNVFGCCRSVDSYQKINFISEGTYGMVFRARCLESGKKYALKQVKMGQEVSKTGFPITALRETNILLSLNHPNIISIKEMVVGSSIDKIFMVMDLLDLDLKTCMDMTADPFFTSEVKQFMLQLLLAVEHIHANWFIHRDLKSSNLLYCNDTGQLKVCDFGMARKFGDPLGAHTPECVTLWYRSPEVLLGARDYSTPSDMWSVGCIFGELLLRKPLFPGQGEVDQISRVFNALGKPTELSWPNFEVLPHASKISWRVPTQGNIRALFPATSFVSGGLSLSGSGFNLMCSLLEIDPAKRISASEALAHPWFKEEPLAKPQHLMPKFVREG